MSVKDFRDKLDVLRRQMEREFDVQIGEFKKTLQIRLAKLSLSQPHKLYLAQHLPRRDALLLAAYANRSSLNTVDGWNFTAMPETQLEDEDSDRERVTGLYEVVTTY